MPAHQINLTTYVEERLDEWGRWCQLMGAPRLNYNALSNLGKIKLLGGIKIDNGTPNSICPDNPSAEEMEILLLELLRYHKLEADALISYYSSRCYKQFLARKAGVSLRTFEARMRAGKLWLEGKLSSDFEKE